MPSANSRADPGILKTSQWRTSSVFLCTATSGSCMISAKVIVFAGTLVHCRRGETGFGSDCVNLAGISPPSANAVVVRVNPGPGGAFFAASWAIAETRMTRKAPHPNANLIVVTPFAGSEYQGGVRVCRRRAREWLRFRPRPTVSRGHRHATATRARAGALFLERALLEEYLLPDPRRTLA